MIALGCDHGGYDLKQVVNRRLLNTWRRTILYTRILDVTVQILQIIRSMLKE